MGSPKFYSCSSLTPVIALDAKCLDIPEALFARRLQPHPSVSWRLGPLGAACRAAAGGGLGKAWGLPMPLSGVGVFVCFGVWRDGRCRHRDGIVPKRKVATPECGMVVVCDGSVRPNWV